MNKEELKEYRAEKRRLNRGFKKMQRDSRKIKDGRKLCDYVGKR